jgi:hypothetical protein
MTWASRTLCDALAAAESDLRKIVAEDEDRCFTGDASPLPVDVFVGDEVPKNQHALAKE